MMMNWEILDEATKRGVVFSESFKSQVGLLHSGDTFWDFQYDTKTYKNAWDALKILKDKDSNLQKKDGWYWINATRIK